MNQSEKLIGDYLAMCLAEDKSATMRSLLDYVAKECKLEIFKEGDIYNIKNDNGYFTVIDVVFTLMRMEKEGIIAFHQQGESNKDFEDINHLEEKDVCSNCGKISGTAANYITTRCNEYIYTTDELISHFKENEFETPALLEAKKQTKSARETLCWAIATLAVTVISSILNFLMCS